MIFQFFPQSKIPTRSNDFYFEISSSCIIKGCLYFIKGLSRVDTKMSCLKKILKTIDLPG